MVGTSYGFSILMFLYEKKNKIDQPLEERSEIYHQCMLNATSQQQHSLPVFTQTVKPNTHNWS